MKTADGMAEVRVRLKKGRERPVERGSAWVFSGAVEEAYGGEAGAGAVADVVASDGRWLGRGLWDPDGEICVRVMTRQEDEPMDGAWLERRVRAAAGLRFGLYGEREAWRETTGYRMVFSEADGLSGLVADLYGDWLSIQLGSAAWAGRAEEAADRLMAATGAKGCGFRWADGAGRGGAALPELPTGTAPETAEFRENGAVFEAGTRGGQKTGFYLDQRDNRAAVARLAKGRRVLSAYCYTGGFEVAAARAGAASAEGWDSSEAALAQARRHHELNGTSGAVAGYEAADVPSRLRKARDRGESWDLIVLDPPKLVGSRAGLERGLRGYKDINLLAMKLLSPGGVLATFSCSGLVDAATFRTAVGWAARDCGREVRIVGDLGQPGDHPRLAGSGECDYLKGLVAVVE
jgi:23S rRNA (cytosine1962-C5)-methyltransferase